MVTLLNESHPWKFPGRLACVLLQRETHEPDELPCLLLHPVCSGNRGVFPDESSRTDDATSFDAPAIR